MKETWPDEIIHFIKQFSAAKETFLHGCCYWFAWILYWRFREAAAKAAWVANILYEPVQGHFIFGICDTKLLDGKTDDNFMYFDVRGDVTDMYKGKELYTIRKMMDEMPDYYRRLMRDCRDFLPPVDMEAGNE